MIFPLLREICEEENITFIEEPSRGMYGVLVFENGRKYYIKDVNFNLNYVSSVRITKNKALTSYFLDLFNYSIPQYTMVYSDDKCKKIGLEDDLRRGIQFADIVGYPIILKINDSSKGRGIYKVYNKEELMATAKIIFSKVNTFQIQKYYDYNDYRVVVLGDKIISAYQRIPLYVIGDGVNSIKQLLNLKQKYFVENGRDTIINIYDEDIKENLSRLGYCFDTILQRGEKCILRNVSNLSAGGDCIDLTNKIHEDYINLCVKIAQEFNLNLSGIDIMCEDICKSIDEYIVLEVNSSPGLDNYAFNGKRQERYVKELYRKVILFIKEELSKVVE